MEILIKKNENDKAATVYNMIHGISRKPLKDFDGVVMELDNYIVYRDINSDGVEFDCVSLREKDGTIWTTNGATFVREFLAIIEACESCGESLDAIRIIDGTSKKGRTFRTCEMVE